MIKINKELHSEDLSGVVERLFEVAGKKIASLRVNWNPEKGSPVKINTIYQVKHCQL
jgi:hypothetical protein